MGFGAALAGVVGAGVGIYGAQQQAKAAKAGAKKSSKALRAEARDRAQIGEEVKAEAELARRKTQSAETARGLVMGQLGREGTYGPETAGQGEFTVNLGRPSGLSGLWAPGAPAGLYGDVNIAGAAPGAKYNRKSLNKRDIAGEFNVGGYVADPYETAANITGQAQFGAVSKLVAEANQLANRQGPLWDTLNNSVVGSVFEGAARQQREMLGELSKAAARGGGSARAGLRLAQRFAVQESVNRERTSALWQARLGLEQHINTTIQGNLSFANQWVDNQAGIRDSFVGTMNQLRTFWSTVMPGIAAGGASDNAAMQLGVNRMATDAKISAIGTQTNAIEGLVQIIAGAAAGSDLGGSNDSTIGGAPGAGGYQGGGVYGLPGGGAIASAEPSY